MYTLKQINSNISKFRVCEGQLVDSIYTAFTKGKANPSFKNANHYFILKDILVNNNCINLKSSNWLFSEIKNVCSNCVFTLAPASPIPPITFDGGIITENEIQIYSENNLALIKE